MTKLVETLQWQSEIFKIFFLNSFSSIKDQITSNTYTVKSWGGGGEGGGPQMSFFDDVDFFRSESFLNREKMKIRFLHFGMKYVMKA